MRFTIVTPVMNGMPWLADCVRSIDAQRGDPGVDVEHIVLDAGSTDGSREWLRVNAPRAILVFEPDGGQTDALLRGFARATGDVLGWLNGDDVLEPHALRRAADALAADSSCVGVSGAALIIDGDGHVVGAIPVPVNGELRGLLASPTNLAQPSTFFRADAYRAVGGLDPEADLAMDVALWLRLAARRPFHVLPDDVLSRFRIHAGARSVRAAARTVREDLHYRRRAGMPLFSMAGISLLRDGYVVPALVPLWRRVPSPLRRVLRPGSRS